MKIKNLSNGIPNLPFLCLNPSQCCLPSKLFLIKVCAVGRSWCLVVYVNGCHYVIFSEIPVKWYKIGHSWVKSTAWFTLRKSLRKLASLWLVRVKPSWTSWQLQSVGDMSDVSEWRLRRLSWAQSMSTQLLLNAVTVAGRWLSDILDKCFDLLQ